MSLWKSLFGGGGGQEKDRSAPVAAKSAKSIEYNGYRIEAQPYAEAGQFQLAGTISKDVGGVLKQHRFVRADRFASAEDAAEMAIMKGRQIIDQVGERMFDA